MSIEVLVQQLQGLNNLYGVLTETGRTDPTIKMALMERTQP
jgi:hypothetical protein